MVLTGPFAWGQMPVRVSGAFTVASWPMAHPLHSGCEPSTGRGNGHPRDRGTGAKNHPEESIVNQQGPRRLRRAAIAIALLTLPAVVHGCSSPTATAPPPSGGARLTLDYASYVILDRAGIVEKPILEHIIHGITLM